MPRNWQGSSSRRLSGRRPRGRRSGFCASIRPRRFPSATGGRCWRRSTIRRRRQGRLGTRFADTAPGSPMQGDGDREADSVVVVEPFDPARHERSGFSCGTERLDNFLRFSARKQQKDDFTRVFVAVAEGSPKILGYYALNAHAVATGEFGADSPKRAPNTGSIPALYLSMIAVGPKLARQETRVGSCHRRAWPGPECRRRGGAQAGCSRRDRRWWKRDLRPSYGVLPPPRFPEFSRPPGADVHHHRHDPGHVRPWIACRGGLRRKRRNDRRNG